MNIVFKGFREFETWEEFKSDFETEVIVDCPEQEGIIEFDGHRVEYYDDYSCTIDGVDKEIKFFKFGLDDVLYPTHTPEDEGAIEIGNLHIEYFDDGSCKINYI